MASTNLQFLPSPFTYHRHQPEKTTLYKLIQKHLLSFYQHIDNEQEKGLPDFVKKEFEAFLKCGFLAHGFLRVQCESCRTSYTLEPKQYALLNHFLYVLHAYNDA